ncbi:MAG: MFS transporter, partial [Rikenellaceae bacterium]|nr:MFS transporter [Rikenellaceae bacterium]
MKDQFVRKLRDSKALRWGVLLMLSLTLMSGYLISDIMAPLGTMLQQEPTSWSASEYGFFTSGYGWINVFLFMLIFGGMILDRLGLRFTGLSAILTMLIGTAIKYWAVSTTFENPVLEIFGMVFNRQVLYAALGFAVFAVGVEITGLTANKGILKWFKDKEMATAVGMNTAFGRLGTALALYIGPKIAYAFNDVSMPLLVGLFVLCMGLGVFIVFCIFDRKLDRQISDDAEIEPEEPFRFRDLKIIGSNSGFWLITILCVLFYSAVFPFLKFASDLMFQKFGVELKAAGDIPALLPFGTILLTPFFGNVYDRKGRGATIMIIGAVLLVVVHTLFSVPALDATWMAIVLMVVLGVAFSLVPSAMWPSVAKILPYRLLGTAYGSIFWVQNIGLMGVPMLIGWVLSKYCRTGEIMVDGKMTPTYDYTIPMLIFAGFGVLSIL